GRRLQHHKAPEDEKVQHAVWLAYSASLAEHELDKTKCALSQIIKICTSVVHTCDDITQLPEEFVSSNAKADDQDQPYGYGDKNIHGKSRRKYRFKCVRERLL